VARGVVLVRHTKTTPTGAVGHLHAQAVDDRTPSRHRLPLSTRFGGAGPAIHRRALPEFCRVSRFGLRGVCRRARGRGGKTAAFARANRSQNGFGDAGLSRQTRLGPPWAEVLVAGETGGVSTGRGSVLPRRRRRGNHGGFRSAAEWTHPITRHVDGRRGGDTAGDGRKRRDQPGVCAAGDPGVWQRGARRTVLFTDRRRRRAGLSAAAIQRLLLSSSVSESVAARRCIRSPLCVPPLDQDRADLTLGAKQNL
jgi:hypothetical protein